MSARGFEGTTMSPYQQDPLYAALMELHKQLNGCVCQRGRQLRNWKRSIACDQYPSK